MRTTRQDRSDTIRVLSAIAVPFVFVAAMALVAKFGSQEDPADVAERDRTRAENAAAARGHPVSYDYAYQQRIVDAHLADEAAEERRQRAAHDVAEHNRLRMAYPSVLDAPVNSSR